MKGNTMTENNNMLATIEKTLQDFTSCKDFLRVENKNNMINKLLQLSFDLYEKHKDKGGFLRLLFRYDKTLGWSKPSVIKKDIVDYFDFCNIDYVFSVKSQKLFLEYDKNDIVDYITYKQKVKDINKENKELINNKLGKYKLPFTIDKLGKEDLQAIIYQCQQKIKTLNKKD